MKSCRSIIVTIFAVFAVCLLAIACTTRPKDVLSQDKMVDVFVDLYMADAVIRGGKGDFTKQEDKDALIAGILKKHKITQAELDSSLVWYADNSTLYQQVQDTVSIKLQKRKAILDAKKEALYTYQVAGFTTELPEFYLLDKNRPTLRFRIDSAALETFGKDKFKFSFTTSGVDTTINRLEAKLYFKYKDSTIVDQRKIVSDTYYEFVKPNLEDSLLREITGYVHLKASSKANSMVLLNNINNLSVDTSIASDSIQIEGDSTLMNIDSLEHQAILSDTIDLLK